MTATELASSAQCEASPPDKLSAEAQALWHAKKGNWHEAHDICPLAERRASKKSSRPSSAFSLVNGLSFGNAALGLRPSSTHFTSLSTVGAGHFYGGCAYCLRSEAASAS